MIQGVSICWNVLFGRSGRFRGHAESDSLKEGGETAEIRKQRKKTNAITAGCARRQADSSRLNMHKQAGCMHAEDHLADRGRPLLTPWIISDQPQDVAPCCALLSPAGKPVSRTTFMQAG